MRSVCGQGIQYHFGKSRHLDKPRGVRVVRQGHASNFDVIFRRNADLGVGVDFVEAETKLGPALAEDRFVMPPGLKGWLISSRPEIPPIQIAQINERAATIARWIFPPPSETDIAPKAL